MVAAWNIDDLPCPHLATALDEGFAGVTDRQREILAGHRLAYGAHWGQLKKYEQKAMLPLRRAHLRACNLPDDYDSLTNDSSRTKARHAVYSAWYDKRNPGELCTSVDALIAALYCWVEHIEKASEYCSGLYFSRDAKTKYELVRMVMSPPRIDTEPAKTVIHMPRGTGKTITVIRQLCKMMAICRPHTKILVSEINESRTMEEIGGIREDVENNEIIHAEFGGAGVLWPKSNRTGKSWSDDELEFLRFPMCKIQGFSFSSAQRGRHPIFGVIDDPEDETTIAVSSFRRKFFGNLFGRYMGMFYKGGKIAWMGTTIRNSCLSVALRGIIEQVDSYDEVAEVLDTRFQSWNRFKVGMIRQNAAGERESIMPDHVSVEGYDEKVKALGRVIASAELDGDPMAYGDTALIRDEYKHSYMHAVKQVNGRTEEYFLDMHTGETMPWEKFLDQLRTFTACDAADSLSTDADYGAVSTVGINPIGKVFLLDQYNKKLIADEWPEVAFAQAIEWDSETCGFDVAAMQKFVLRIAIRLRREWEEKGKVPPRPIPIEHGGKKKHLRVLGTLRPLYRRNLIAFPYMSQINVNGVVHVPATHANRAHINTLKDQLDDYTDEGPGGHDDAADAFEMAVRSGGQRRGRIHVDEDPRKTMTKQFARMGVDFPPALIPEHMWTQEMRDRVDGGDIGFDEEPARPVKTGRREVYDPYD